MFVEAQKDWQSIFQILMATELKKSIVAPYTAIELIGIVPSMASASDFHDRDQRGDYLGTVVHVGIYFETVNVQNSEFIDN